MLTIKSKLLLHICCVGCGVYVSQLLKQDYEVMLFFYNPNIWPEEEYGRRLKEAEKVASRFKLKLIKGEFDHENWLAAVNGHEGDPEKGERCLICYKYRLEQTVKKAQAEKCGYFSTTLTTSPHKDAAAINKIGEDLAAAVYSMKFLNQNFKKQDGFKKSAALSRELGLYRQNYCGCEFSKSRNSQLIAHNS